MRYPNYTNCLGKWCSVGTFCFTKCSNSSTAAPDDLNYHVAKKHATSRLKYTYKFKIAWASFPASTLYNHTNAVSTECRWRRLTLMWMLISNMSTTGTLRKSFVHVDVFWLTEVENGKRRVVNFGTSVNNWLTTNWIMYLKNSNVLPKWTSPWDFFWEKMKINRLDTFMPSKTVLSWKSVILHILQIWTFYERDCRKWMSATSAPGKKLTLKGKFSNLTVFVSLFEMYPCDVNTLLTEPLLKNHKVNCPLFEWNTKQTYNDKPSFYIELYVCMVSRKDFQNFQPFLQLRRRGRGL